MDGCVHALARYLECADRFRQPGAAAGAALPCTRAMERPEPSARIRLSSAAVEELGILAALRPAQRLPVFRARSVRARSGVRELHSLSAQLRSESCNRAY